MVIFTLLSVADNATVRNEVRSSRWDISALCKSRGRRGVEQTAALAIVKPLNREKTTQASTLEALLAVYFNYWVECKYNVYVNDGCDRWSANELIGTV